MNGAAIKVNQGYLLGTTAVAFGTAGLGTITAEDYMYSNKMEVNYSGTSYVPSDYVPVNQYSDDDTFNSTDPKHTWVADTVFKILPAGNGGTVRISYSKGEPIMDSDSDELPHPMRRYTRGFTAYALACAQELDGKDQLAATNYGKAQKVKADFINEITPRDRTGVKYIDLTEGLSGMQEDLDYI